MSDYRKNSTKITLLAGMATCVILILIAIFSMIILSSHSNIHSHIFANGATSVSTEHVNKNISAEPLSTQSAGLFSLHKPITTKQYTCTQQIPVSDKTSQVSSWIDSYLGQVKNLSNYTPCISRVSDEEEQTGSITFIKKGYNPKGAFNLSGKKITKQYTCTITEPTSKQSKVVSHWIDNYLSLVSNLRDYNVTISRVADNQDQTGVITFIRK